jgi:hypothetical protein
MTKPDPAAEERAAEQLLAQAKRARLRAGRQRVADWPSQTPKRPEPKPVVDIVAIARAELSKDSEDGTS